MAWEYVIDDEKIANIESNLGTASKTLVQYNTDIGTKVTELGECWSGPSYDALVALMEEYKTTLDSIPTMFDQFATTIQTIGTSGTATYNTVKTNLNFDGIGIGTYTPAESESGGLLIDYSLDVSMYETADDIYDRAKEIESNLYADIEIIYNEIRSQQVILEALKANLEQVDDPETKALLETMIAEQEARIAYLNTNLEAYQKAYNDVCGLTKNGSNDFLDWLLRRESKDGDLLESADHILDSKDDKDQAERAAATLNGYLDGLVPVVALCETSTFTALYANNSSNNDDTHIMDNYRSGTDVSDRAMEAAYEVQAVQKKTHELVPHKSMENVERVEAYNSTDFLRSGMDEGYQLHPSSTVTFSQMDSYGAYGVEVMTDENGNTYDSVKITKSNGEVSYLTLSQYNRMMSTLDESRQIE